MCWHGVGLNLTRRALSKNQVTRRSSTRSNRLLRGQKPKIVSRPQKEPTTGSSPNFHPKIFRKQNLGQGWKIQPIPKGQELLLFLQALTQVDHPLKLKEVLWALGPKSQKIRRRLRLQETPVNKPRSPLPKPRQNASFPFPKRPQRQHLLTLLLKIPLRHFEASSLIPQIPIKRKKPSPKDRHPQKNLHQHACHPR